MSDGQAGDLHPPERRLGELDGLRALAALSVLLAHFNPAPWSVAQSVMAPIFLAMNALAVANLGVAFFFVLSAFLLTWISTRELDTSGRLHLLRFYGRRTLRIWPLYFLTLGIALAITSPVSPISDRTPDVGSAHWHWAVNHLWHYLFFVSNWSLAFTFIGGHIDPSPAPLRVLWSIAVEEQFYVIFPLILPVALISRGWAGTIGIAIILLSIGFRAWFMAVPVDRPATSSRTLLHHSSIC